MRVLGRIIALSDQAISPRVDSMLFPIALTGNPHRLLASFLLLVSVLAMAGCDDRVSKARPSSRATNGRTFQGDFSHYIEDGWEACELTAVGNDLIPIDTSGLFVVEKGIPWGAGDGGVFKFELDGIRFEGSVPTTDGISWWPFLAAKKPDNDMQTQLFIVVLKKAVDKSVPPAQPLTVDSIPQRATESNTGEGQYPSTGVEMWDPMPPPKSPLPEPKAVSPTAAERERVISVAREYLFKGEPEPRDIEYHVRRTDKGYSVFVVFANVPGGHCFLTVSPDWKVTELIRGA